MNDNGITGSKIQPHRVTKPIQLVAAWLAGLILIDAMFLAGAVSINSVSWHQGALVISAIANVPIFLGAIFLLQTRFRAELQEDSYYSEYLSKRTSQPIRIDKNHEQDVELEKLNIKVASLVSKIDSTGSASPDQNSKNTVGDWSDWLISVNRLHPEFSAICEALNQAQIPIENYFGTDTMTVPQQWIISINNAIPTVLQVDLLRVLINFQFSGFNLWKPVRQVEENEDVYIGSYGTEQIMPFSPRLKAILARPDAAQVLERSIKNRR